MRFYYNKEKEPKYMVSLYAMNVEDHWYYDNMKQAKDKVMSLTETEWEYDVAISLWNMKKDERKIFIKIEG